MNVARFVDAFGFDDRTAVLAQVTVPFLRFFTAHAKWWRVWHGEWPDGFAAKDDWSVGIGVRIRFDDGSEVEASTDDES